MRIVHLPGLRDGGDIADAIAKHGADATRSTIERMISEAVIVDQTQLPPARDDGAPVMLRLSDVEPKKIEWLWPNRLPRGVLIQLSGDPDQGKTTVAIDIVARITTGRRWPDTPECAPLGSVIFMTAEDMIAETIVPRLLAAGADRSRVFALSGAYTSNGGERTIDFDNDLLTIERAIIAAPTCRLVVVDPITAYLGDRDTYNASKIRPMLSRLRALAEKYGVTIIMIEHFKKGEGSALHKPSGSVAFIAATRAAYCCCADKNDEATNSLDARHLFLPLKANLGPKIGGLAYRLKLVHEWNVCAVNWEDGAVLTTADEALGDRKQGGSHGKLDEAKELLESELANGPRSVDDLRRAAKEAGMGWRTIERAKVDLRIVCKKAGWLGKWAWSLPGQLREPQGDHEDRHTDAIGDLRTAPDEIVTQPPKAANAEGVADFNIKQEESGGLGGDWGTL